MNPIPLRFTNPDGGEYTEGVWIAAHPVTVAGNARVFAYSTNVVARGKAAVHAYDDVIVSAYGLAKVTAMDNVCASFATLFDKSYDSSYVLVMDESYARAHSR